MLRRLVPLAGLCLLLGSVHPASTSSIQIVGPSVRIGEKLVFGPGTRLEIDAADGSGPSLAGPWAQGDHEAGPVDPPVRFSVDAEPPAVSWEVADEARGERGKGRFGPRRARGEDLRKTGLSWPLSAPEGILRWNPAWASAPEGTVHESVEVRSDLPEVFLRLGGVRLMNTDTTVPPPREGQVLQLRAEDGGSRVERMVLRTRTTADGPILEVEALDGVGNSGKVEWRLEALAH
ncbi:MAG TPA: hypothetical protein VNM67_11705 [Thermoanaerobaculia bacterium]|jgi:hypothetical protein|nr:hypothetical protein [Thermoanaerobaculia bacterium]